MIGHYCYTYGARRLYPSLLLASAIPIACAAFVTDNTGYTIVHFFIGIAGVSFVITQYHCSRMFAGKIVGTANATSANALMPLLLSGVKNGFNSNNSSAWR